MHRALHAPRPQAFALNSIASSYLEAHQPKEALERLNESLDLARAVGDRRLEASVLSGVALAHWYGGNLEEALARRAAGKVGAAAGAEIPREELQENFAAVEEERAGMAETRTPPPRASQPVVTPQPVSQPENSEPRISEPAVSQPQVSPAKRSP